MCGFSAISLFQEAGVKTLAKKRSLFTDFPTSLTFLG